MNSLVNSIHTRYWECSHARSVHPPSLSLSLPSPLFPYSLISMTTRNPLLGFHSLYSFTDQPFNRYNEDISVSPHVLRRVDLITPDRPSHPSLSPPPSTLSLSLRAEGMICSRINLPFPSREREKGEGERMKEAK